MTCKKIPEGNFRLGSLNHLHVLQPCKHLNLAFLSDLILFYFVQTNYFNFRIKGGFNLKDKPLILLHLSIHKGYFENQKYGLLPLNLEMYFL